MECTTSAVPCSLHSLTFCIHSSILSDCRHTVSPKFFNAQVPSMSTEELVLPCHTHCVLYCLYCNGHSLLLHSCLSTIGIIEYLSRIPNATLAVIRPMDSSHLILHCPAADSLLCSLCGNPFSLYDLWSRSWRVAWPLGRHGLLPCPNLSEGDR